MNSMNEITGKSRQLAAENRVIEQENSFNTHSTPAGVYCLFDIHA